MKKHIILLLVLFSSLLIGSSAFGAVIIGRIAHAEGEAYRYMDVDQSWVETFRDSPVGTGDIVAAGENSRVELRFPNNMVVRLDGGGEVEIINLEEDVGEFYLRTGLARFHNHSAAGTMTVATARGTAKIGPGGAADVRADNSTVAVAAVAGETTFQAADSSELEVITGATRLEFRQNEIIAGIGPIDDSWDSWCSARQRLFQENRVVRSAYLPETMQEYAHVLEPYGDWRRIYYRGYYYWAWQPRHVGAGWAPYTTGYWYDWHDDPVWIDHNPWGWATHHHGHWIYTHNTWMWTPYIHVSHVPGVTVVGLNVTFGKRYRPYWHPGRVRWISHSSHIGWLPLAPWETYYGHRHWGPRSVRVRHDAGFSINVHLSKHRYIDHAVIIPRHHFKRRGRHDIKNYSSVRIRNLNRREIVRDYKPIVTNLEHKHQKHAARAGAFTRPGHGPAAGPERAYAEKGKVVRIHRDKERERQAVRVQKEVKRDRAIIRGPQVQAGEQRYQAGQRSRSTTGLTVRQRVSPSGDRHREPLIGKAAKSEKRRSRVIESRRGSGRTAEAGEVKRDYRSGRAAVQGGGSIRPRQSGRTIVRRTETVGMKPQAIRQTRTAPRTIERAKVQTRQTEQAERRRYAAERKEVKIMRQRQSRETRQYSRRQGAETRERAGGERENGRMSVRAPMGRRGLR